MPATHTETLNLRVSPTLKKAVQQAAIAEDMNVGEWARATLRDRARAAQATDDDTQPEATG